MSYQIIRIPGTETYAIYSSVSDTIEAWDMTREDVTSFFVEDALWRVRKQTSQLLDKIDAGNPAYYQFTKTWKEALALDREHGGEYTRMVQSSGE